MIQGFEWDKEKGEHSFGKQGASFDEAASVFFDLLSVTIPDSVHSTDENRYVIIGDSLLRRHLVVIHTDRNDKIRIINAPSSTAAENENMNVKNNEDSEMLDEYDFSGGIRGKYVERLKGSSQAVLLEPDVAEIFTDSESVNQTLRSLLPIIHAQAEKVQQH